MGIYKLGYFKDLDDSTVITDWDAGKAAYDDFGGVALELANKMMCRAIGRVGTVYSSTLFSCTDIINYPNENSTSFDQAVIDSQFSTNEFDGGFIKFLSGNQRNVVAKVDITGSSSLLLKASSSVSGITTGDYFEVVSGASTFDFPNERNPINKNTKRAVVNRANRFPFLQGGLVMFEGYQPDDFVLLVYLTTNEDADRLELMLNHGLDYVGFDGPYSYDTISGSDDGLAPMILETGVHDTLHQYLVYMNDYKIVRDAKYNDEFSEFTIHFLNYSSVIYRGV